MTEPRQRRRDLVDHASAPGAALSFREVSRFGDSLRCSRDRDVAAVARRVLGLLTWQEVARRVPGIWPSYRPHRDPAAGATQRCGPRISGWIRSTLSLHAQATLAAVDAGAAAVRRAPGVDGRGELHLRLARVVAMHCELVASRASIISSSSCVECGARWLSPGLAISSSRAITSAIACAFFYCYDCAPGLPRSGGTDAKPDLMIGEFLGGRGRPTIDRFFRTSQREICVPCRVALARTGA